MARLFNELSDYLRRQQVSKAGFRRLTGFPESSLFEIGRAENVTQRTIDKLWKALTVLEGTTPEQRASDATPRHDPVTFDPAGKKRAVQASARHVAAFRGARFVDASAGPIFIDLARIARPSVAGSPCGRCGAARTCEHRPVAMEVR